MFHSRVVEFGPGRAIVAPSGLTSSRASGTGVPANVAMGRGRAGSVTSQSRTDPPNVMVASTCPAGTKATWVASAGTAAIRERQQPMGPGRATDVPQAAVVASSRPSRLNATGSSGNLLSSLGGAESVSHNASVARMWPSGEYATAPPGKAPGGTGDIRRLTFHSWTAPVVVLIVAMMRPSGLNAGLIAPSDVVLVNAGDGRVHQWTSLLPAADQVTRARISHRTHAAGKEDCALVVVRLARHRHQTTAMRRATRNNGVGQRGWTALARGRVEVGRRPAT